MAQALGAEPGAVAADMDAIERRVAEISRYWADYMSAQEAAMSPAEKELAERAAASRQAFVARGLHPAVAALRAGDMRQAAALVRGSVNTLARRVET